MQQGLIREKNNFLVFGAPDIRDEEINEVVSSLKSGWIGTGPKVQRFEEQFKEYKNTAHSISVNSCTAALHLSIIAAGIGTGDEVITTAMTFCATVNAIIHSGATPVLVDCDYQTQCINPLEIKKKITRKTKAIIPVHFAGYPCDMDKIMAIAREHKLIVIEDCAHAIETLYKGKPVGTLGDFGCFSFYVTKNVVTAEGGMVITNNNNYAERVKILALHGMSQDAWKRFSDDGYKHYQIVFPGFKYNMTDLQAALGIHQLRRVDESWKKREDIWNNYTDKLSFAPIKLPSELQKEHKHGHHLYTIMINKKIANISRDDFLVRINQENIGVGVHYKSIASHPYYQERYGWRAEDFPNANKIGGETLSIPLSSKLNDQDVHDVIAAIRKILNV
ncbi:MAG: DegT/DnrJ/EryC1/StrS family aminotransferase [Oligoflexia bacterium]|nr:DegT/DnrJ/EryC1/StrS family aminotransferase [Oligoflexia bacterium]